MSAKANKKFMIIEFFVALVIMLGINFTFELLNVRMFFLGDDTNLFLTIFIGAFLSQLLFRNKI